MCEVLENGAKGYWDNEQKMAFTFVGDQWYGYETPRSMREKVMCKFGLSAKFGQRARLLHILIIGIKNRLTK